MTNEKKTAKKTDKVVTWAKAKEAMEKRVKLRRHTQVGDKVYNPGWHSMDDNLKREHKAKKWDWKIK